MATIRPSPTPSQLLITAMLPSLVAAEADADALSAAALTVALVTDSFLVDVAVAATNPVAASVAVHKEQVLDPAISSAEPLSNGPSPAVSSCGS